MATTTSSSSWHTTTTAAMNFQGTLHALQMPSDLAILRLTDPVYAAQPTEQQHARVSNASTISNPTHDPRILKADLHHYRDLFSKLRFSYVEQVTKEKFLRAVTADRPELVQHAENARLAEQNKENKQALSEMKEELQGMLSDLQAQSTELARRYNEIQLQTTQLEAIPVELEELQSRIASFHDSQPRSADPEQRLPLRETLSLLAEREREAVTMDSRIASLKTLLPQKQREIELLQEDLGPLQMRQQNAAEVLSKLEAERQQGGFSQAELQVRWLRGQEAALKAMLAT